MAKETVEVGAGCSTILVLAIWFGLVMGLMEGLEQMLLQALGAYPADTAPGSTARPEEK